MIYSITELSKQFNLPASTIRYYEKIGLLENVEHVNSRRFYTLVSEAVKNKTPKPDWNDVV